MDWLRRNWPDLLIGIALVAVIAGIIATLITGGSFFPVGQSTRTSTPTTQGSTAQSVAPKAPSTSSNANKSSSGNNGAAATTSGSSSSSSASNKSSTTAAAPSNGGVSVLPPSGSSSGNGNGSSSSSSSSAASGSSSTAAPATAAGGNASSSSSTTAAAAGNASPSSSQPATASNGPGAAAPYRISVGAFSHKSYAQRQEALFKKAGYPVFLASQGDLTIVLVGPYKSQSEAEKIAGKIKNGGYGVDPVVYQFQGTSDQAPAGSGSASGASQTASSSSSGSASSSSSSSGSTPSGSASSVPSGIPSAPSGEHYLQVGAYGTVASAKPQRDRLQGMGYTVQERSEGGLIKLLIGPFGSTRLQQVQSRLKSAGIASFPR